MVEGNFIRKVWISVFFVIIWLIWKERNVRIFYKKEMNWKEIYEMIFLRMGWWIEVWEEDFLYLLEEVV